VKLRTLLFLSASIGIAAFGACWSAIRLPIEPPIILVLVKLVFLILWAAVQAVGIWKYRWRGLWILVGLPPILLLPLVVFWAAWSCEHGNLEACI